MPVRSALLLNVSLIATSLCLGLFLGCSNDSANGPNSMGIESDMSSDSAWQGSSSETFDPPQGWSTGDSGWSDPFREPAEIVSVSPDELAPAHQASPGWPPVSEVPSVEASPLTSPVEAHTSPVEEGMSHAMPPLRSGSLGPALVSPEASLADPPFEPRPAMSTLGTQPGFDAEVPTFRGSLPEIPRDEDVVEATPRMSMPSYDRAAEVAPSLETGEPTALEPESTMFADRAEPLGNEAYADESDPKEPDTPADETPEEADYEVVRVFYGTDRSSVAVPEGDQRGFSGWFYATAAAALATALLMGLAYRDSQKTSVTTLTVVGVLVTLGLGVIATIVRMHPDPSVPRPCRAYGNDRGQFEMGTCEVSIPKRHEVGNIERPSIFRFEFQENPSDHVMLLSIEEQPADAFYSQLRQRVGVSENREAFVFIHGFNVTFEAAAQRTAQLAHDLEFSGAAIFYSWPSQGDLLQYGIDETNVVWTVPHLKRFLTEVSKRSGAKAVHLIAHSMGNRALTSALRLLSYEMQERMPMFQEVVLTAPDIDAAIFRRDIAPAILGTAERVTLYASSNDEALKLSKTFHGYRRAGDSGDGLVVIPGLDTIDVSTVDTSLIGHDYYGSNQTVLADLVDVVKQSKPPHLRQWLEPMRLGELMYWAFNGSETALGVSEATTRR